MLRALFHHREPASVCRANAMSSEPTQASGVGWKGESQDKDAGQMMGERMVLARSNKKKIFPVKCGACVHLCFIFSFLAPASLVTSPGSEIHIPYGIPGPRNNPRSSCTSPWPFSSCVPLLRTSAVTSCLCPSTLHQYRRGRNISLCANKLLVPNVYMKLWLHQAKASRSKTN